MFLNICLECIHAHISTYKVKKKTLMWQNNFGRLTQNSPKIKAKRGKSRKFGSKQKCKIRRTGARVRSPNRNPVFGLSRVAEWC